MGSATYHMGGKDGEHLVKYDDLFADAWVASAHYYVPTNCIRRLQTRVIPISELREGCRVLSYWRGSGWVSQAKKGPSPGTITNVNHSNGKVTTRIRFDDGEVQGSIPSGWIENILPCADGIPDCMEDKEQNEEESEEEFDEEQEGTGSESSDSCQVAKQFKCEDRVECDYKGEWRPATYCRESRNTYGPGHHVVDISTLPLRIRTNPNREVDTHITLPTKRVRRPPHLGLEIGDRIEVNYLGRGRWYPATYQGEDSGACENTQMLPKPHKTEKACVAAGNCEWVTENDGLLVTYDNNLSKTLLVLRGKERVRLPTPPGCVKPDCNRRRSRSRSKPYQCKNRHAWSTNGSLNKGDRVKAHWRTLGECSETCGGYNLNWGTKSAAVFNKKGECSKCAAQWLWGPKKGLSKGTVKNVNHSDGKVTVCFDGSAPRGEARAEVQDIPLGWIAKIYSDQDPRRYDYTWAG